jgi:hypothetical protein
MTNHDLGAVIQRAALDFSAAIVRAIRGASLGELLEMQGPGAGGRKRGPKPGRRPGRPAKAGTKAQAPARKGKGRQRLSGEEKRAVLDKIVGYLVKHPASKGPAVAAALGLETIRAGVYLKELRAARRVTTRGQRASMVYSVAAPRKSAKTKAAKKPVKKAAPKKKVAKKVVRQPEPAPAPAASVEAPPAAPTPPVDTQ